MVIIIIIPHSVIVIVILILERIIQSAAIANVCVAIHIVSIARLVISVLLLPMLLLLLLFFTDKANFAFVCVLVVLVRIVLRSFIQTLTSSVNVRLALLILHFSLVILF